MVFFEKKQRVFERKILFVKVQAIMITASLWWVFCYFFSESEGKGPPEKRAKLNSSNKGLYAVNFLFV